MRFLLPFLVWSLLGLVGIALFAFTADPELLELISRQAPDMPPRLLLVLQPAALTIGAVALGVQLGKRPKLKSWLTQRLRGGEMRFPAPGLPLLLGFLGGVAIMLADMGFFALVTPEGSDLPDLTASRPSLLLGLTYGGITEELMLRYGFMTFLFWAAAKSFGKPPAAALGWFLVLLVALIFGLGHLPAMSHITVLTGPVIIRTVLLNGLLGTLYGWLYWRRGLEAGIMAHMASHVGFRAVLGLVG